ncbi:TBC1 domain family member 8B [Vigna radiata var. radiata]|uniref:TBC1 domain family member 8B n=1 Tax=Vigna radiata var. radiata TaxID=3916 RepID=A0A1S3V527_VIGRR|nr:TBC1 domain family member 8B [Vigna radiata var. radiata]XP_014513390.1 TBC1 domain family member 8B [Vigna radiata var. radiata]XP_014513391.1 TBC1 domain family member 8B [Vigna radiata var. radiata]XP_014513392.1 TBC1 domain family member 8B [Vigna radiata var. radiata]
MKPNKIVNPLITFEHKRDAYGFTVRPQHLQRYREYANIYKEEEEERSDRWSLFLERQTESTKLATDRLVVGDGEKVLGDEVAEPEADPSSEKGVHEASNRIPDDSENAAENDSPKEVAATEEAKVHRVQLWTEIRSTLRTIEDMMSVRVKKKAGSVKDERIKKYMLKDDKIIETEKSPLHSDDVKSPKGLLEEDSEEEYYDVERSDPSPDMPLADGTNASANGITADAAPPEASFPWREELEVLVRGGVPMALRGELWQAFVGVKARRVEKYYQDLLASESDSEIKTDQQSLQSIDSNGKTGGDFVRMPEKWKGQIEKDLPRTFPGHPALDEDGRNALRRLLTAYARHNPSVGYCQAMNFFAGLLLLLMPEENAFWTLMGILDDYFDGYYSEEMIESQVDQLVFEELVRERFPKLANHLDYLGVQVAWVTGPWFLSIFVNMLPWESVLRVWDVLLFEGNRVMLFRTAVALMELYGPALVTTKDAGDAVTLLQSLAGSTFDSSQLVLTACMGYQNINETRLQQLRNKHRPAVIASIEERSKGLKAWRDSQGLASKLFGYKHDSKTEQSTDMQVLDSLSRTESGSTNADEILISLTGEGEIDSVPDLQEQVVWLKVELCRLLEEKRSSILRAEELETALMEMVKQDNRRELSAKVEQLEEDVAQLRQALSDKQEQETAMLQVLMRVEQEQKVTEDARRFAEQDAAAQRYAAQVLQEKYEEATAALTEMEKRAVMAESMLEATLQYQHGQVKVLQSPRSQSESPVSRNSQEPTAEIPARRISLLSRPFGLGWRDRNKGKPSNVEEPTEGKPSNNLEEPAEGKPSVEEKNTIYQQEGIKVQDESRSEVIA